MIGGSEAWDPVNSPQMVNIDLDHNLFMNLWNRCPLYSNIQSGQFINNIVYNWGWYASSFSGQNHGGGMVDFIGNFYRRGPTFKGVGAMAYRNTPVSKAEIITHDNPDICIRGNKGPNQPDPQADNWGMMERLEQIWVPADVPPGRARADPAGPAISHQRAARGRDRAGGACRCRRQSATGRAGRVGSQPRQCDGRPAGLIQRKSSWPTRSPAVNHSNWLSTKTPDAERHASAVCGAKANQDRSALLQRRPYDGAP